MMHENEAIEKGMKLVPIWLPILGAIATALFTSGATFATVKASDSQQDKRIERIETVVAEQRLTESREKDEIKTRLSEIAERLARIEGKLQK